MSIKRCVAADLVHAIVGSRINRAHDDANRTPYSLTTLPCSLGLLLDFPAAMLWMDNLHVHQEATPYHSLLSLSLRHYKHHKGRPRCDDDTMRLFLIS